MRKLRVASRRSELAMTQTQWVLRTLQARHPNLEVEIVPVVTKGDRILDISLSKVGGKGLFVSEIEACLLSGEADFAVHSLKDVPATLAPGLQLSAIPKREDPRDALICRSATSLRALPKGAVIGTSSLRRVAQLAAHRPDLRFVPIRGNIDTRLEKLRSEGFDAIVLAAAGLHRLGWQDAITEYLSMDVCLPAVGQGILGIESRADDEQLNRLLRDIHHPPTADQAMAERTLLAKLNGGCQVPMAGYAERHPDGRIWLRGMVASTDGRTVLRAESRHLDPQSAGELTAEALLSQGAGALLESTAADKPAR
ncbi:porphobilinogen deaminase [Alicyclobacillus contaminans]|uniref:hydroxymethylbilane synthase n=1 Tax=Alicyclobacillus contaminans TaxID=392016 RepID=UPI0003F8D76A|nr:hydroxymethylbilane synthase [Alicyclobacillus contaminans]GMA52338.1 porphobilinogen deaminase [Alicyclobacillus contaminans]